MYKQRLKKTTIQQTKKLEQNKIGPKEEKSTGTVYTVTSDGELESAE